MSASTPAAFRHYLDQFAENLADMFWSDIGTDKHNEQGIGIEATIAEPVPVGNVRRFRMVVEVDLPVEAEETVQTELDASA